MSTPQWFAEFERQEAMRQERIDDAHRIIERAELHRCPNTRWDAASPLYCGCAPGKCASIEETER